MVALAERHGCHATRHDVTDGEAIGDIMPPRRRFQVCLLQRLLLPLIASICIYTLKKGYRVEFADTVCQRCRNASHAYRFARPHRQECRAPHVRTPACLLLSIVCHVIIYSIGPARQAARRRRPQNGAIYQKVRTPNNHLATRNRER